MSEFNQLDKFDGFIPDEMQDELVASRADSPSVLSISSCSSGGSSDNPFIFTKRAFQHKPPQSTNSEITSLTSKANTSNVDVESIDSSVKITKVNRSNKDFVISSNQAVGPPPSCVTAPMKQEDLDNMRRYNPRKYNNYMRNRSLQVNTDFDEPPTSVHDDISPLTVAEPQQPTAFATLAPATSRTSQIGPTTSDGNDDDDNFSIQLPSIYSSSSDESTISEATSRTVISITSSKDSVSNYNDSLVGHDSPKDHSDIPRSDSGLNPSDYSSRSDTNSHDSGPNPSDHSSRSDTNSHDSGPNPSDHSSRSGTNSSWRKDLIETRLEEMRLKLYNKVISFYPQLENKIDKDNIVGQMQTTYASLLQPFVNTWNKEEDTSFLEFVTELKQGNQHLHHFIQNATFLLDTQSSRSAQDGSFPSSSSSSASNADDPPEDVSDTNESFTADDVSHASLFGPPRLSEEFIPTSNVLQCITDIPDDASTGTAVATNVSPHSRNYNPSVTSNLQDSVMQMTDNVEPWKAELKMDCYMVSPYSNDDEPIFMKNYDILQNLSILPNKKSCIYFDPQTYNPQDGFLGEGWKKLTKALRIAANNGGYCIMADHSDKQRKVRRFGCQCGKRFYGNRLEKLPEGTRGVAYTRDRQLNNRKDGIHKNKKARPYVPLRVEDICHFYFNVICTNNGFSVVGMNCNVMHEKHIKIENPEYLRTTSTLRDEVIEDIRFLDGCNIPHSAISHIQHKKNKCILTNSSIRYAVKVYNRLNDLDDLNHLTETEQMLRHFNDNKYKYVCLFDKDRDRDKRPTLLQGVLKPNSDTTDTEEIPLPSDESEDARIYLNTTRDSLKVKDSDTMLVAVAWILEEEMEQFYLCPEVAHVDTTSGTNNQKRPLLTIVGKNSKGHMFPVLRAFLPNERRWVFRWIFLTVLPQIYGRNVLQRVEIVMSDGDQNEMSQIDEAIDLFMCGAIRFRCGWHIVVKGWDKYIPKVTAGCSYETFRAYNSLKKIVCNWIYSWMNENCLHQIEFETSVKMLHAFIDSEHVCTYFSEDFRSQLLDWLKSYVEPHARRFVFYRKKELRCFDVYTNCAQESTHHGMKYNSMAVSESHSLTKAAIVLSENGKKKLLETQLEYSRELRMHNQHLNAFIGSHHILYNAELMKGKQWEQRFNYENLRTAYSVWKVRHSTRKANTKTDIRSNMDFRMVKDFNIIPDFVRIYTVTQKDGIFYCSCKLFKRMGYGCRHIDNVLASFEGYMGPTSKDFSYRWQKNVCYFWLCTNKTREQRQLLLDLMTHDVEGPYCDPYLFEDVEICREIPADWDDKVLQCTNYDVDEFRDGYDHLSQPAGMSQISNADFQHENNFSHEQITYRTSDPFTVAARRHMERSEFEMGDNHLSGCNVFAQIDPMIKEIIQLHSSLKDSDQLRKTKQLLSDRIADLKACTHVKSNNSATNCNSSTSEEGTTRVDTVSNLDQLTNQTNTLSLANSNNPATVSIAAQVTGTATRIVSSNPTFKVRKKKHNRNENNSLASHRHHRKSPSIQQKNTPKRKSRQTTKHNRTRDTQRHKASDTSSLTSVPENRIMNPLVQATQHNNTSWIDQFADPEDV